MSSSPDPFQSYFDSHEPKQELDSPFLNEALFVDEEREAASAWETRLNRFQLESPFLDAFEEGWGAITETEVEVEEFDNFLDELDNEEYLFGEDLEEEFEFQVESEITSSSESRTFFPSLNDKTGKTELKAVVYNAPRSVKYRWSVVTPKAVEFTHISALKTELLAGKPGIHSISFEVLDAKKKSLRVVHTYIGVPQFVSIGEFGGTYTSLNGSADAHLFNKVLQDFYLLNEKNAILGVAKNVGDFLLEKANVRLIWDMPPFNEKIPRQYEKGGFADGQYNPLVIAGYTPTGRKDNCIAGETEKTNGDRNPSELIAIYPGAISCGVWREVTSILNYIQRLESQLRQIPTDAKLQRRRQDIQNLWIQVFGRFLGYTISHEIYHALLGASRGLDLEGHTLPPKRDLLSSTLLFQDAIGIEINNSNSFPAANTFLLKPISSIVGLNDANQARVNAFFPVPPNFPFSLP